MHYFHLAAKRSSKSHLSLPSCVKRLIQALLCPIGTSDQSVSASTLGILLGAAFVDNFGLGLSLSCTISQSL